MTINQNQSDQSTDNQQKDNKNQFVNFSLQDSIRKYFPQKEADEAFRILYGAGSKPIDLPSDIEEFAALNHYDIKHESMLHIAQSEQLRPPKIVKVAAIQNSIEAPTTAPVKEQYLAIQDKIGTLIDTAGKLGANVLCLQEAWTMPFAFCTREKMPWLEFAEDAREGNSTKYLMKKAKQWNMVILSPILERDDFHQSVIFNTCVVINSDGTYLGKQRKIHIPRVGDFNESTYYLEGDTGHPVFETQYGKIGINICYGRHHPLHWMTFGLNGADIVFNPSATVGELSEPLWYIEARNAAIANSYYTVGINRVGTESFPNEFTSGDGKKAHKNFGHFYGSSYVSAPDGSRSVSLSRSLDGLLVVDIDLNLNRQTKDKWMFQSTARYDLYANVLKEYTQQDYKPQRVRPNGCQ